MYSILGAGLAGISASFHLGHHNCEIFEKAKHAGGHIHSDFVNGFTWDEGPHVSFTKHPYVKELFEKSVGDQFLEYPVYPVNYFEGSWISHPAQSNLHAIPEPLRSKCLEDFLSSRQLQSEVCANNYKEWLDLAFGSTFSNTFPSAYTEKYWTVPPSQLSTEWIGERVFFPDVELVKRGYNGPLAFSTHYISSVRYPTHGGFKSFAQHQVDGASISFGMRVSRIDLHEKMLFFDNGHQQAFENLISTIPLPEFISCCEAPDEIKSAANMLCCSELLLINLEVDHPPLRNEHWLYVYDRDKYSTRINFTDLLSPNNAPSGKSGIQVEVYFSRYKEKNHPDEYYAEQVIDELILMGLVTGRSAIANYHTKWVQYANVIFDHQYRKALDTIFGWLSSFGLVREYDDLSPLTDWECKAKDQTRLGSIVMCGRFGQWKYYWTDDCVLRAKFISKR